MMIVLTHNWHPCALRQILEYFIKNYSCWTVFSIVFIFFFIDLSDLFYPLIVKCRGLLLHPTTLKKKTHTHKDTRYGYSGREIGQSQRPLPDNTQYSKETDIRAARGIQTWNLSKGTASDPRFIPRGPWDQSLLCMFVERTGYLCSTNGPAQPHPDCVPRQFTHVEFTLSQNFSELNSIQYFYLKRRENMTAMNVVCIFFKTLDLWSYAVCVFLAP